MIGEQQGHRSYRRKKTKSLVAGSRYKLGRFRNNWSYNNTVLALNLKKKRSKIYDDTFHSLGTAGKELSGQFCCPIK